MMQSGVHLIMAVVVSAMGATGDVPVALDTGYRGIWYFNQPTGDEYVYKYSGGLGTYCAKHIPMAVYAEEVDKTFFVYGGTIAGKQALLEMVSFYDHKTRTVPRPTILLDKKTDDAHDNPVLAIDGDGHLWVFASSHGTSRPSYIFRGRAPYDIRRFEQVSETNFSYPQPWYLEGKGFLFLHTYYKGGRGLYWSTSADGREWSERRQLAHIEMGHYQISWPNAAVVGTAFNYHPNAFQGNVERSGLNWRTNLYYLQTDDMGSTWRTADRTPITTPLTEPANPALVHDYHAEGLLVYVKDLKFDASGRPIILHLVSKGWAPGPEYGPHTFRIAHWRGDDWAIRTVTNADNNYDTGSLTIEPDAWRLVAPTETGPQAYNPGGEIVEWVSRDEGVTWTRERDLTQGSAFNHTYIRAPLDADPGFCAFWADGDARAPSTSRLYFYDREAAAVFRLPESMTTDEAMPERVAVE